MFPTVRMSKEQAESIADIQGILIPEKEWIPVEYHVFIKDNDPLNPARIVDSYWTIEVWKNTRDGLSHFLGYW